ncbi:MAG: ABC transporter substrate-binding protein [Evtepia sp.]
MRHLTFKILLFCSLCTFLSACGEKPDIMTQTVLNPNQIPVTVLVKQAFSIHNFEVAAETKFPNLDLIQIGNYTSNMGIAEYEARLEHDDLTDLVMTWPLDVGKQYWSKRLLDLSALPFTGKYVTSRLDGIAQGGKLYYLPGPSQIRGIVYNKTLFEELGLSVPTNFQEFVDLCHEIETYGIRALQLGLANPEVLDTAFVGFSFDHGFSKPKDTQWIINYDNGIGHFGDQFQPALDTFQTLIDNGILKPQDLSLNYSHREQMLFTRQCAMVEDSVLVARMGQAYTGCTDEFALMPFFTPNSENSWVRLYPVCYIGVNQDVTKDQKNSISSCSFSNLLARRKGKPPSSVIPARCTLHSSAARPPMSRKFRPYSPPCNRADAPYFLS